MRYSLYNLSRPLLTFLIIGYNQEPFIREAIAGAFSQTYSPLEIILSDDHSTDKTFKIMQEMAETYVGPHEIVLNRNSVNMGIGRHISKLMEKSRGDLVVVAAGDDISLPERTEIIYNVWEQSGRKATSIFSSHIIMTENGQLENVSGFRDMSGHEGDAITLNGNLLEYFSNKQPIVNGCTHAWSPYIFKYLGPIKSDLEDVVLSFRTLAIGQMMYLDKPLVKYRRHTGNVSFLAERKNDINSFEHREKRLKWVDEQYINAYDNMISDIETLNKKGKINNQYKTELIKKALSERYFYLLEIKMMDSSFINRNLSLLKALFKCRLRLFIRFLPRALPRLAYRKLYIIRENMWNQKLGK